MQYLGCSVAESGPSIKPLNLFLCSSVFIHWQVDELEWMLSAKEFYLANTLFMRPLNSVNKIHLHFYNRLKLELKPAIDAEVNISRKKAGTFRTWLGE